jgi:hypothetical protein
LAAKLARSYVMVREKAKCNSFFSIRSFGTIAKSPCPIRTMALELKVAISHQTRRFQRAEKARRRESQFPHEEDKILATCQVGTGRATNEERQYEVERDNTEMGVFELLILEKRYCMQRV